MEDALLMQYIQPDENLGSSFPDLPFSKFGFGLLMICDFLLQITAIGIFHDDTQEIKGLIVEGFLVGDDIFGLDGCEDSDFVEGVLFFFFLEFLHFNFFQGVDLAISGPLDFVYGAKGALAELGEREKVL